MEAKRICAREGCENEVIGRSDKKYCSTKCKGQCQKPDLRKKKIYMRQYYLATKGKEIHETFKAQKKICLECGNELWKLTQRKYCSKKCGDRRQAKTEKGKASRRKEAKTLKARIRNRRYARQYYIDVKNKFREANRDFFAAKSKEWRRNNRDRYLKIQKQSCQRRKDQAAELILMRALTLLSKESENAERHASQRTSRANL